MNQSNKSAALDHEEYLSTSFSSLHSGKFLRPNDTAKLVKELVWHCFELSRMAFGWVPAVETYEVKLKLARFGYLHAMHAKQLLVRLDELPNKIGSKERTPVPIRELYTRASLAPSEEAFFQGYALVVQKLYERIDEFMFRLDPVLDAPSVDVLEVIAAKKQEILHYAKLQVQFVPAQSLEKQEVFQHWQQYVVNLCHAFAQQLNWPEPPVEEPIGPVPTESKLDPRFPHYAHKPDQYKRAYSDPAMSPLQESVKQMHYINATEIAAAETLAYLYYAIQQMPLEFFFDLARHLWDETRHSEIGIRRLQQLGYSLDQFVFFKGGPGKMVEDEWYADMYASLTMVAEPCSFIKKRKAAEAFWEFGDPLSAIHCEYDMVDERMHVDFGKVWGPELFQILKNDLITAQKMSERARNIRLEYLEVPLEERQQIAKSFPAFCGFSTVELNYTKY